MSHLQKKKAGPLLLKISCLGKLTGCSPEPIYKRDVMLSERRSDRLGELEIKKGIWWKRGRIL